MQQKEKRKFLLRDTYLALIKNSIGSNLFRNSYYRIRGKKQDIVRDGSLSCALYVSSVLRLLNLISAIHTTVDGTVRAMETEEWEKINTPRAGAVLVWEARHFKSGETHKHIGFYLGNQRAVSHSDKKKCPAAHHWTFGVAGKMPQRKIETIFWNAKLV